MGLTTGQAARYCLVSSDTIVNWIKVNDLPAQRTIGGQFRIFVEALRQFMIQNEMSTDLLDAELDCRPYCWENRRHTHGGATASDTPCNECLVFRTKALNCYELRAIDGDENWCDHTCEDCSYYQKWAGHTDTHSHGSGE